MSAGHTPGPWRSEADGTLGRHTIYADDAHDVRHFAVARAVEPDDAPLIAAAPELADEIKATRDRLAVAVGIIEAAGMVWMGQDGAEKQIARVDALLAKATGADPLNSTPGRGE